MHLLPPIGSVRRWHMAGIVLLAGLMLTQPARARSQIDFSLDREFRWRVAPAFTVNPPPNAAAAPPPEPTGSPPRTPTRQHNGGAEADRRGLTLLRLPFTF